MKPSTLRLLVLEDVQSDAELEIAELENAGYRCNWKRVETREDYLAALEAGPYDIILSDFALPAFDGLSALQLLQERAPDIPFILVSGTLGEEAAINSLKAGATDYVMKTRLSRLGPVVERALSEQAELRKRTHMQRELQAAGERFRAIVETAIDAIITIDAHRTVVDWNRAAEKMFGYTADEMLGDDVIRILPDSFRDNHINSLQRVVDGGEPHVIGRTVELVGLRKDGSEFPIDLSLARWTVANEQLFTAIIRNVTDRKQAELALRQHNMELEQFNKMATGRELRMIELKQEVNALCRELGRPEPYA